MFVALGHVRVAICAITLAVVFHSAHACAAEAAEPDLQNQKSPKSNTNFSFPLKPMPEVAAPDEDLLRSGVVHRVIDGDSVELFVDGQIVAYELAGADAPEVLEDRETQLRGSSEAKAYLESLVVGEQIAVLPDRKRATDARGRRRGYLYRMPDRLLVNLEMVRVGHAKHARDPQGFNNSVLLWAQDRAKSARKGVWSPVPVQESATPKASTAATTSDDSLPIIESSSSTTGKSFGTHDENHEPEHAAAASERGIDRVVYVTRSGTKYHRKDCQHARATGIAKDRDELDSSFQACKVCEPDKPEDND